MSSQFPFEPRKNNPEKQEPFQLIKKSMNQFFQERPVKNFLQSMDEFFSNPFPNMSFPVSVNETADEHIIKAELAGINKEQIHLDVFDYRLTISVTHLELVQEENENQQLVHKSQTYKKSSRTIALPYIIDEKKVKASYQNGLLTIRVKKQKGKKINILS
ncbi:MULTISPECIES: Hsp20/alpha crystallin family protein [Bacillaceae]|uniref:Hsp20/alpha crystallin family protein n=1 Tax=Bacillaceae TaxID=186817 RepID=UPI001E4048C4|nr:MULTISPECIES: Hsp20/alpha crystallin family protein [Bacillaceae]MCE4047254.1 Hsp20/alpha crystallin family protein [Bacillus sp. Au-Bac7]MCM3031409.1 Hsp20/alpha crystallin family protein [Niallia sp. MER 6]